MAIIDILFFYYVYIIIFGGIAAIIFLPFIYRHKKLRRAILIINIANVLMYVALSIIARNEKKSPVDTLKTVWYGSKMNY